jgi:hypothetical protein
MGAAAERTSEAPVSQGAYSQVRGRWTVNFRLPPKADTDGRFLYVS